jgi:hypothetical protein
MASGMGQKGVTANDVFTVPLPSHHHSCEKEHEIQQISNHHILTYLTKYFNKHSNTEVVNLYTDWNSSHPVPSSGPNCTAYCAVSDYTRKSDAL